MRAGIDVKRQTTFVPRTAEAVLDALQLPLGSDDGVLHRNGAIRLVVGQSRRSRHQRQRHQLSNENHAATRFAADGAPDVEAKIHFLEVAMEEGRDSQHVGVEKKKSGEADEVASPGVVELSALGQKTDEDRWIDFEVEHGDVAPFSSQKYSGHLRKSIRTLPPISPRATVLLETSSLSFHQS